MSKVLSVTVGEPYETISPVTVRSEESLESDVVHQELPMHVPIEILQVSQTMPRRVKIQAGKLVGWISFKTAQDEPLIMKRRREDAAALQNMQPSSDNAEVKSNVTVRAGEALDSPIVKEVKPGSLVQILEKGSVNQRRARVKFMDTGDEGWISLQTKWGEPLVGPVSTDIKGKSQGGLFNKVSTSKVKELLEAARDGNIDTVRKVASGGSSGLLAKLHPKPSINCTDVGGKTPLIYAAAFGHKAVVKYLLSVDEVSVNMVDGTRKSALHHACKQARSKRGGAGDAHDQLEADQTEVVTMLVNKSASLEGREHNGMTPLMFAVANGNISMSRVLMEAKADVNIRDYEGHKPLDYANNFDRQDVGALLRKYGATSEKTEDYNDEKDSVIGRSAEDYVLQHLATSETLGEEQQQPAYVAAENVAGVAGKEAKKRVAKKKAAPSNSAGDAAAGGQGGGEATAKGETPVKKKHARQKKGSLKGEEHEKAARRASISNKTETESLIQNIVVGEDSADPKEAALAKLTALVGSTSCVRELSEGIKEAKAAGLDASQLAPAEDKLKQLKGRMHVTEELVMAIDAKDVPKLNEMIPKAEASKVSSDEIERAKATLKEEQPKHEARQKLAKAKEAADTKLLEQGIKEGKAAGLTGEELGEYEAVLKAAQSKDLALDNLKKAIASKNVQDLKSAIALAKEIGLKASEVKEAEKVLAVEEPKQKARECLQEAIEDPTIEKLREAMKLAKKAGLDASEFKEAEAALVQEERKEKALDAVKKVLEDAKSVDRESIDSLKACKEKFTVAIEEARNVGVAEALISSAEQERRKIHNKIEDLKGSIRVFCRVRPLSSKEKNQGDTQVTQAVDGMTLGISGNSFMFDAVFTPGTQEEVFNDCKDLVQSAVDGYNVTMFAYGQTGAGKTFTMYGTKEMPGTTPRTIQELYRIVERDKGNFQFTITGSMMELYRNDLVDLLTKTESGKSSKKLNVRADKNSVVVENLTEEDCPTEQDLNDLLERGNAMRTVAATAMNSESSRSHLIVCIKVVAVNKETDELTRGKILMCDLAGSERLKKSEVTGDLQKEAIEINKSLTALGDVIEQLTKQGKNIPYRNHKLTQVMQDALGGNAKTLMFVNCSPAASNEEETVMSLKWATRAKKITNKAVKG